MELKKATRKQVKLRMSIASPTGFGKTHSALLIAYGITGDWSKIAVIDTENESASLYSDMGEFNAISIKSPFTPERYTEAIHTCENAGMEVIIIDSVTHVWSGQGGLLEYNNSLGGRYQDWAKTTPRYQKWLDSILQSKCHVITTIRKKQAYEMIKENNKIVVEKKGMENQVRDNYDYEMTIAFEIITEKHLAKAAKDRTRLFADGHEFIITSKTGEDILKWCNEGKAPIPEMFKTLDEKVAGAEKILSNAVSVEELTATYKSLAEDVKKDKRVIDLCAEIKLHFTNPVKQPA